MTFKGCGQTGETAFSYIDIDEFMLHLDAMLGPGMQRENRSAVVEYTDAEDPARQKSLDNQPPLLLF
jgi:hypothetical protein